MNKGILFGAILLAVASFDAQAQSTNTTNASRVGASATNDPGAVANDRTGRGQSVKRQSRNARPVSGATVDGSNGSATNDGASGQSGSPAPLPPLTTQQGTTQSAGSQSTKATKRTSSSSGTRTGRP